MPSPQPSEEGVAEWVMSYADMITILMAFFVVMFSMAGEKDPPKEQAVMESLRNWLGPVRTIDGTQGETTSPPRSREPVDGEHHGRSGATTWRKVQSLGGSLYLDQNETALTPSQQEQLKEIVDLLSGKRQLVEIQGVPGARWSAASSTDQAWDVLWAKCRLVADQLVALGIDRQRLQMHIASLAAEPADHNLLSESCDFRIDVNLSDRFLREP
jgi:chemotaxis protein MotB